MTEPPTHRIGLIGAGDVAKRFWLPRLLARPRLEIAAVCSEGGASARQLAAEHDIARSGVGWRDYVGLDDVDTVIVTSPPHTHLEIASAALEAGRNVLVEKPLCATLDDCRDLIGRAQTAPGVFSATFNNRLRENNDWVRRRVLAGAVGRPRLIDLEWLRTKGLPAEPWRSDPGRAIGGVLADLGSHLIAIGLGAVPERKRYRATGTTSAGFERPRGIDDLVSAQIEIDGSPVLQLRAGWAMAMDKPVSFRFRVVGADGVIEGSDYEGGVGGRLRPTHRRVLRRRRRRAPTGPVAVPRHHGSGPRALPGGGDGERGRGGVFGCGLGAAVHQLSFRPRLSSKSSIWPGKPVSRNPESVSAAPILDPGSQGSQAGNPKISGLT